MFKNIKIGYRLVLLVFVMSLVLVVVSSIGIRGIRRGIEGLQEVFSGGADSMSALNRLASAYRTKIVNSVNQVESGTLSPDQAIINIEEAHGQLLKIWEEYLKTQLTPEQKVEAEKLDVLIHNSSVMLAKLEAVIKENDKPKLIEFAIKELHPTIDPIMVSIFTLVESHLQATIQDYEIARQRVYFDYRLSFILMAAGIFIAIILALLIVRSITKPLSIAVHAANRLALGDASVQISVPSNDEIGQLLQAMQSMVIKLRGVISEIQGEVRTLSTSTQEIVSSVSEASSGTAETAAAVTETMTTVEELKQTAQISAEKAQYVLTASEDALKVVKVSETSLNATLEDMHQIEDKMRVISESIIELSRHSQAIAVIIGTVDDLAQQSNLLAVNAAIEAARAGEQGKSFGVVAQEIRMLAEQSKNATVQVRAILDDIRNDTNAAVIATEQGAKAVTKGVSQSRETQDSINAFLSGINRVTQAAKQIAISSQQQLVGVDQVTIAMTSINSASVEHVEHMKQIESAVIALNDVGRTLKKVSAEYTL